MVRLLEFGTPLHPELQLGFPWCLRLHPQWEGGQKLHLVEPLEILFKASATCLADKDSLNESGASRICMLFPFYAGLEFQEQGLNPSSRYDMGLCSATIGLAIKAIPIPVVSIMGRSLAPSPIGIV